MWRPNVSFDPPTLNDVSDWANERIRAGISTGQNIAQNTIDDVRGIFDATSTCLTAIDNARLDLSHRAIEYSNRIVQESLEPLREWIARFGVRWPRRDPRMRLFLIDSNGDRRYLFGEGDRDWTWREIRADEVGNQKLVLLIHGLNTDPTARDAYSYWDGIVKAIRPLRAHLTDPDYAFVVVSWDSEIRTSDLRLFGTLLTQAGSLALVQVGMMLGFDEFVRRARIVGGQIAPILSNRNLPTLLCTHSLGAECASYAIHQVANTLTDTQWIDFQPAVPQNAWDENTGRYRRVGESFANGNPNSNRHVVVHSELDIVLSLLYNTAVLNVPAGLYGSSRNNTDFDNVSVVNDVRESHGPDHYFDSIDVSSFVRSPFD